MRKDTHYIFEIFSLSISCTKREPVKIAKYSNVFCWKL